MYKPDLKADLTAIGAIFTIMVLASTWLYQYTHLKSLTTGLKASINQLEQTNAELYSAVDSLNSHIDEIEKQQQEVQTLIQIKDELLQDSLKRKKQQR